MAAVYAQPMVPYGHGPSAHHASSSSHHHAPRRDRGYRVCDQCGRPETPTASRFRLCGGCMTTQYCSQDCQKNHWPAHKPICQHTQGALKSQASAAPSPSENVAKNLRKFTSAHEALLTWAGFQALQLKRMPSNVRHKALLIQLSSRPHAESHRRLKMSSARLVSRDYVNDPLVQADIQRRDERCRREGGIGAAVVILEAEGVSQVMPVEVDSPADIAWDTRDDWQGVLYHFIDIGRTDFAQVLAAGMLGRGH
ncbi:hypothetical protein EV121DRAFT_265411 [Schizophyllum commune]|nr:hypothetical protein K525DRAFT_255840 [Schizophyllum commune Loenen D]